MIADSDEKVQKIPCPEPYSFIFHRKIHYLCRQCQKTLNVIHHALSLGHQLISKIVLKNQVSI